MSDVGVKIIDISNKPVSLRQAKASAHICLKPHTLKLIQEKKIPKGDILTLAQCAGIMAAKKVDELIPLAHSLPLEYVDVELELVNDGIVIHARCKTRSKTGVEMEAMAACSLAALTIYDMCKSIDRGAIIKEIKLMEKSGGKSGSYKRE